MRKIAFPKNLPYHWVIRMGWLPGIEIKKVATSLDQMRFKGLHIVQFECPGHRNPSHYTIWRVKDLSLEDHIQS